MCDCSVFSRPFGVYAISWVLYSGHETNATLYMRCGIECFEFFFRATSLSIDHLALQKQSSLALCLSPLYTELNSGNLSYSCRKD